MRGNIPACSLLEQVPFDYRPVSRIKGSAAHVYGTIEAPSADAAVRKIVDEYQITDPEMLKRLAVRPGPSQKVARCGQFNSGRCLREAAT
jgi:hypothetical protein